MDYNINIIELIDNGLVENLKNMPKSNSIVEVDVGFIKSQNQRGVIIIDGEDGLLLASENIDVYDDEYAIVYGKLMSYILDYGRPKKVRLKNNTMGICVSEFCKKIGVESILGNRLINIEKFLLKA